jgi:3-hydroxyacyl-CoA dehydrogenase / enoyl-CoA hydratase / 3-hydroxybutyryl-CoA epimerase
MNEKMSSQDNIISKSLSYKCESGVAILRFEQKNSPVNTLNSSMFSEFENLINRFKEDSKAKALVIVSGKEDSFIAGADIKELQAADTQGAVEQLSIKGQELLNHLEDLEKPTVAAIHGACLGGGLELALACTSRVASDESKTILGLPEVMLGLIPGAGGTQKLPRLVGIRTALSMMLTGAPVRAKKAKKIGLVDHLASKESLLNIAVQAAQKLAMDKDFFLKRRKKLSILNRLIEGSSFGRNFLLKKTRDFVRKKTRGLYPAPSSLIDVVEQGYQYSIDRGYVKEAQNFAKLSQSKECRSLMHLYFLSQRAKKNPHSESVKKVSRIGVLGAGLMGSGIGLISIQKGLSVSLKDINYENLARGQKAIAKELALKVKKRQISEFEAKRISSFLHPTLNMHELKSADLIIEAVFEDVDLKKSLFKELEQIVSKDTIIASNTSALPIGKIIANVAHRERFLGMHYFSPVHKMPLLEIIKTKDTAPSVIATAFALGLKQSKTMIIVNDSPGFYTTRIMAVYVDEAAQVCLEGVDFAKIDQIMKDFGFPVGPMTLVDEVGLDVAQHVSEDLGKVFGKRVSSLESDLLKDMIAGKYLGRKTGEGFFVYNNKPSMFKKLMFMKKTKRESSSFATNLVKKYSKNHLVQVDYGLLKTRMAYRMINEAIYCLQDGVLDSPKDGDIGAVYGLGFPPFLGGPFHYCDMLGAKTLYDKLDKLSQSYGERFAPSELLKDMAKNNKRFYNN